MFYAVDMGSLVSVSVRSHWRGTDRLATVASEATTEEVAVVGEVIVGSEVIDGITSVEDSRTAGCAVVVNLVDGTVLPEAIV